MVIGQRLVRRLCPDSRKEKFLEGAFKEIAQNAIEKYARRSQFKNKIFDKTYEGVSSPSCPMGSKGRMGIFQFFIKLQLWRALF